MKFKLLFSYRFLLFILSVIGVYLQLTKHGGFGMMLYYTILSNMLVMFFMGDMVWRMLRGRSTQTQGYLRLKGGVTMSIMITCVIYHFMLAPIATPEKFYRLENFLCHYIVPLMFFFDTLVIDKPKQYRKSDPLAWTLLPLLYMVFALLNGLIQFQGQKTVLSLISLSMSIVLVGSMWSRWRPSFLSLIYLLDVACLP